MLFRSPNTATAAELTAAVRGVLDGPAPGLARALSEELRQKPGRAVARSALLG